MFEGHDTTSSALTFINFLLADKSATFINQKLSDEIDQYLPDVDEDDSDLNYLSGKEKFKRKLDKFWIDNDDFENLNYLDAVIRESLRLFPSVPIMSREKKSSTNWPLVPVSSVCFLTYKVGRDSRYWSQPLDFIPERWTGEKYPNEGQKINPYAWMPFSVGSRNCIGQRFAMLEMKIFIVFVMKFFKWENLESREHLEANLQGDIILRPYGKLLSKVSVKS